MNLRDLKYFVTLVDTLHFGKAAEACFVSQPSLSIQIKKLEESLGVTLLERSNRSVIVTDIGKIIAEQARELLQRAATIQSLAKQAQDPFSGELNVGIIPTLTNYLLPQMIPHLTKTETFPKLSLLIAEHQTAELLLDLKKGKLDAALLSLPIQADDLTIEPLFEEELMIAVPAKHILAKKKRLLPSDLQNQDLLMLEEGHCLREQAMLICHKAKAKEAKRVRAANLEVLRYMVTSNVGLTIMPRLACQAVPGLKYLPLDMPQAKRRIALVWRKSSAKRALLEKMVAHIRPLLAKQAGIRGVK